MSCFSACRLQLMPYITTCCSLLSTSPPPPPPSPHYSTAAHYWASWWWTALFQLLQTDAMISLQENFSDININIVSIPAGVWPLCVIFQCLSVWIAAWVDTTKDAITITSPQLELILISACYIFYWLSWISSITQRRWKQLHCANVKQWLLANVSWCYHKARRVAPSPLRQAAVN